MNLKKIAGHDGYARDENSGAVININNNEIRAARERKLLRRKKEQEIVDLKNEVGEIKNMLNKLIEKLDG